MIWLYFTHKKQFLCGCSGQTVIPVKIACIERSSHKLAADTLRDRPIPHAKYKYATEIAYRLAQKKIARIIRGLLI